MTKIDDLTHAAAISVTDKFFIAQGDDVIKQVSASELKAFFNTGAGGSVVGAEFSPPHSSLFPTILDPGVSGVSMIDDPISGLVVDTKVGVGGVLLRGVLKPLPSGPTWKATARLKGVTAGDSYTGAFLAIMNTTTGQIMSVGVANNTSAIQVNRWASSTGYDSRAYGSPVIPFGCDYMSISFDGSSIRFGASGNRIISTTMFSENPSNFIGAFDKIGVVFNNQSNLQGGLSVLDYLETSSN